MRKTGTKIVLTGFPGFIGRRLVREIARAVPDARLALLVEARFAETARQAVAAIKAEGSFDRLGTEVVACDISRERLGLGERAWDDLREGTTDVFHLAAIYDLAVPEAIARAVNVGGTRHVVEFCLAVKGLRKFVYFSTCYVAGKRTGAVYEDDLVGGFGFKNHYESTKHEAERIVRDAWDRIPTVIVRPGITVGDSKTGETQKFDGPCFGMILIDKLRMLQIPLPYLGASTAEVNLVPLDFVVDGTMALWRKDGTDGKCYALADPNPETARVLYAGIVKALGARGPLGSIPPILLDVPLRVAAVRKLLGVPREVLDYFNHDVHFDTRNATAALEGTGVRCPRLTDYLPVLVRYYRENRDRPELRWKAY